MNESTTKIIKLSQTNTTNKINKINKQNNQNKPYKESKDNLNHVKPIDISNKISNKTNNNKNDSVKKSSDPNNINNVSSDKKLNLRITETEYERPLITHTEKLSKQQIQKLLEDYEQINNINELSKVPIGTHLRYFDKRDNELKFRTGGILIVNTGLPDYVILSSGHIKWSVQTDTSIFFRRITLKEYKEEVEKTLLDKEATIKGLHLTMKDNSIIINKLKNKIKYYESLLKKNKINYDKDI
jgi:hypothetical protein